jgi:hypothetical protein
VVERIDGFGSVACIIVDELRGEKRTVRVAPTLDCGKVTASFVSGAIRGVMLNSTADG